MRIISLLPTSKRGKQIVKQHGQRWEVVESRQRVLFDNRNGPWLLILPLTEERALPKTVAEAKSESASRWVHEFNDENFKVAP